MDEIEDFVYELIADFTGDKTRNPQEEVTNIDNYDLMLAELEVEYDIVIDEDDAEDGMTVEKLIEQIKEKIEANKKRGRR